MPNVTIEISDNSRESLVVDFLIEDWTNNEEEILRLIKRTTPLKPHEEINLNDCYGLRYALQRVIMYCTTVEERKKRKLDW